MRYIVRKNVTADDIAFYLARKVELVPDLYNVYLQELIKLERLDKVSLVPITILQIYHNRLRKAS